MSIAIPAAAGEQWGGFLFFDQPSFRVADTELTPAKRTLESCGCDAEHSFPYGIAGFREFASFSELDDFTRSRVRAREPRTLPPGAILMNTYALASDDGEILTMALNYRLHDATIDPRDPDLWISYDVLQPRPLTYPTFARSLGLGRTALPVQKLLVSGHEGVFLEFLNPAGLPPELTLRSAISWFEGDQFWTVQARGVTQEQLVAVSTSFAY